MKKIHETEYLIKDCHTLLDISGKAKLQRKIEAELRFLKRLSNNPDKLKEEHIRSSNIYHLSAIVRCCLEMQGVIKVLETFSYEADEAEDEKAIVVDIVADYGNTWVKVATRNPLHLYQASIGLGKYGRKSIVDQVQDMVECAHQNLHMFCVPKIIVHLAAGVTKELKKLLDDLKVEVVGEIVSSDTLEKTNIEKLSLASSIIKPKPSDTLQIGIDEDLAQDFNESCHLDSNESNYYNMLSLPLDAVLNLDVSTFLAYVSNMTNGHCYAKYNEKLLTDLAKMEQVRPVKIILDQLFKNRKLVCCETAHRDFLEILATVGGENEKKRAAEMLKRVTVVPDEPSDQAVSLEKTSKIKERSKIVFGTGDMMKAVTVSANIGFLRAARSQGVKFVAFVHESRALTECKEVKDENE